MHGRNEVVEGGFFEPSVVADEGVANIAQEGLQSGLERVRSWAREKSPWQRCEACIGCRLWSGWLCLDEANGFGNCPEYGVSFVERIVAVDRRTGQGRYIVLAKGQTSDDLARAAAVDEDVASAGETGLNGASRAPTGIHFMGYLRQLKEVKNG